MSKVRLPAGICGDWIWLKDHAVRDSFLLFRKEFSADFSDNDVDLWISANTAYQLFINGRLVGFGPAGHHSTAGCYIDQHSIGFFLEPGRNVIAVKALYNTSCSGDVDRRPPGLWCQMTAGEKLVLCTGDDWDVIPADFCSGRRPQTAPGEGLTNLFHSELCPAGWSSVDVTKGTVWRKPDMIVALENFPLRPELYPMPAPVIAAENPVFKLFSLGKVTAVPAWTAVQFDVDRAGDGETFSAAGYVFSEKTENVRILLYSDDPFKLYCNNQPVADLLRANGENHFVLQFVPGWNRLLLVQTPASFSMGFMMVFPDRTQEDDLVVRQDTIDSAAPGWCVAGPLRLTMNEATPSLRFDRLQVSTYDCRISSIPCMEALLDHSKMETNGGGDDLKPMKTGEFRVWKLPAAAYGFVRVSVEAGLGDIVDISVASGCGIKNALPGISGQRSTGSMVCRRGTSSYLLFMPENCLYASVFIRSASGSVKIVSVEFYEFTREFFREAEFRCADDTLNRIWNAGKLTMKRNASFVPLADSRVSQDVFLFDAYADAVNASTLIGDGVYIAAKLRQFLDFQLENGDIPAITHGRRRQSQLHHMLFLPRWIMHNYSFSGSIVELERSLPALDFVRDFFESMIDPDYGLLVFPADWHKADSRLSRVDFRNGRISSCLNSLFCRFLLSASDVYRVSGSRSGEAGHCLVMAEKIAKQVRKFCKDPETGLFYSWADKDRKDSSFDCFCNFCAMYGGIMDPDDFETFFFRFFNYDPPFDKFDSMTPYSSFLFTEMMFACGQRRWIYRYLKDYWSKRLTADDSGWISENTGTVNGNQFSNGMVISPNVFLVKEILGLRSGDSGQNTMFFYPGVDFVDSAEGIVPLNNGRIFVKWTRTEDGGLEVVLDSNIPVAIMPEMSGDRLKRTSFQVSDQVTLLKPPADFDDDADW